jgi:ABC-type Zn uptake system ZnuABC Zn-binding protein ZnuA
MKILPGADRPAPSIQPSHEASPLVPTDSLLAPAAARPDTCRKSAALATRIAGALLLLVLAVIAAACSSGDDDDDAVAGCSGGHINVVTTLPLFAEWACKIGGDKVNVTALVPQDTDPRSFQPPEEDAKLITDAHLVLYNGLGFDQPSLDFVYSHASGRTQVIGYATALDSPTTLQPEGAERITAEEAGDNPLMWLDADTALDYIASTRDSLEIADSDGIPYYDANYEELRADFLDLQQEVVQALQTIPQERRKLVTLYNTFPHFARAYGFELLGFVSETPQETPTQEELDALAQTIRDAGVPAVFADRGYDSSALDMIASQAAVQVCHLYSDRPDDEADTYVEMMRANAEEVARCLGGATAAS